MHRSELEKVSQGCRGWGESPWNQRDAELREAVSETEDPKRVQIREISLGAAILVTETRGSWGELCGANV